jgi:hypothetical protein
VPQKSQRGQNIIGGLSYEPPLFSLQLGITTPHKSNPGFFRSVD